MVVFKEHSPDKARALSAMLNSSVIYFFDLTENSWKYILYHKGQEKHALQADRLSREERKSDFGLYPGQKRTHKGEKEKLTPLHWICKHYVSRKGKSGTVIKAHHIDYLV